MANRWQSPSPQSDRAHRVREAAAFALLGCACGAALHRAPPPPRDAEVEPPAGTPAASSPLSPETAAAFEALAVRGRAASPGMREVARKETAGERVDLARAEGRDVCVRVVFESNAPVVAKLVDGAGNVLVAGAGPATDGVLGERGPVCVRKGDSRTETPRGGTDWRAAIAETLHSDALESRHARR
jgi:hypothetical protein